MGVARLPQQSQGGGFASAVADAFALRQQATHGGSRGEPGNMSGGRYAVPVADLESLNAAKPQITVDWK